MVRLPEYDPNKRLYRLDCPNCHSLQFRFGHDIKGGPLEIKCSSCKRVAMVWFNEAGPTWT